MATLSANIDGRQVITVRRWWWKWNDGEYGFHGFCSHLRTTPCSKECDNWIFESNRRNLVARVQTRHFVTDPFAWQWPTWSLTSSQETRHFVTDPFALQKQVAWKARKKTFVTCNDWRLCRTFEVTGISWQTLKRDNDQFGHTNQAFCDSLSPARTRRASSIASPAYPPRPGLLLSAGNWFRRWKLFWPENVTLILFIIVMSRDFKWTKYTMRKVESFSLMPHTPQSVTTETTMTVDIQAHRHHSDYTWNYFCVLKVSIDDSAYWK